MYALARTEHKEKADGIDADVKKVEEETEEKKKAEEKPSFGGLLPTSGQTVKKADMDSKEAGQAAYQEIFGDSQDPHAAAGFAEPGV